MTTTASPPSSPPPRSPLAPLDQLEDTTLFQYPRSKARAIQETVATPDEEIDQKSQQNSGRSRIDTLTKRILAIDKSECEMKELLQTMRDTSADLDKTMARLKGSLGKLELKYKLLARRKADEIGKAKAKAKR